MNQEKVHAVLPGSNEESKSIKGIAQAMGLEISSYIDWVRAEQRLVWALGTLIKWGWVACDERQKEEGHRFWYNAYWKTELANLNETVSKCEAIGAECALYRLFALHYYFRLRKS